MRKNKNTYLNPDLKSNSILLLVSVLFQLSTLTSWWQTFKEGLQELELLSLCLHWLSRPLEFEP